jgi:hypothetical protein
VRKEREDGARRTRVRLTAEGRQAFRRHAGALERLVAAAREPEPGPAGDDTPSVALQSAGPATAAPAPAQEREAS